MPFDYWLDPQGKEHGCFGAGDERKFLPNYHGDLNAMHEAEKALEDLEENGRLMATYATWKLPSVCDVYRKGHERSVAGSTTAYWLLHATAAQRAEAFLRTLNLWEDPKP
jgi:hypothetical protein